MKTSFLGKRFFYCILVEKTELKRQSMQRCRDSADPHPSVCSTRKVGNVLESGACPGIAIVRMSQGLCQKYSALSLPMMLNLPNQLENPLLPQNSTKVISLISEKLPICLRLYTGKVADMQRCRWTLFSIWGDKSSASPNVRFADKLI